MDYQSFNYPLDQGNYVPFQSQTFEIPTARPEVPSLCESSFAHYQLPTTPPDISSDPNNLFFNPLESCTNYLHIQGAATVPTKRTRTTSVRRRAQNCAAQRAFRERKENHTRDLEAQLLVLTEKYNELDVSHTELNAAYKKLRKTSELLIQNNNSKGEEDEEGRKCAQSRSSSFEILRKLLEILHGEFEGVVVESDNA